MPLKKKVKHSQLAKAPTGIQGLDTITGGGLPKNRPTLLCGYTGCGKTVMSMEFLINGIRDQDEPGVFMAFEETTNEISLNMASLGFNVPELVASKKLYVEQVKVNRNEIVETGKYDLGGLFVRLENAIDSIGAKRVVLDSLDTLFYGINYQILRAELIRLFDWLKQKKVTAIVTAEIGESFLTRQGLEEYVADCVIVLDNRIKNQVSTRRIRIVKYRGSEHGNNEYPFKITEKGMSVFPIHEDIEDPPSSSNRVKTGIEELDNMMEGKGYFQGSSILISGSAGTGKSSVAVSLANVVCKDDGKVLYCAMEESPNQIKRNMHSINLKLEKYINSELLHFYFCRPTVHNLEMHLIAIRKMVIELNPHVVILDPVTTILAEDINSEIRYLLIELVDFLKSRQITLLYTAAISLESIQGNPSDEGISSLVDTWILLQDVELEHNRKRYISILKSRGMGHSSKAREFIINSKGISIVAEKN